MGYMIEISESKLDELSEYAEGMLRFGGKLMSCIDSMSERGRGRMGFREDDRSRDRMNWRDEEDDSGYMGERRGVPGSGRRYR